MQIKSILIIDNEQFILKKAQSILAEENLSVKAASSLKEAKEYFPSEDIVLIIFSRAAIGGKDEEFLQNISNYEHLKDVPIVALLGEDDKNDAVNLLKIGIIDYILKPFAPDYLLNRLKEILANEAVISDY